MTRPFALQNTFLSPSGFLPLWVLRIAFWVFLLAAAFSSTSALAADTSNETRLREALRTAIGQQRALEDERAQLLAKNAEIEKQLELLRQQGTEKKEAPKPDVAVLERMEAEFNRRLVAQAQAADQAGAAMEKWRAAYQEAADIARQKEAQRLKLAQEIAVLTQRTKACEIKNAELYRIGDEILHRYAEVGVLEAMTADEPFLGIKRVELQNAAQDYQDKLLDQTIEEGAAPTPVPVSAQPAP